MKSLFVVAVFGIAGCTSVDVRPLDSATAIKHVCVQENPKVIVSNFLTILRDGFDRHRISTEVVVLGNTPPDCEYLLTYTANRAFGAIERLGHAELRIERAGRQVAYAKFDMNTFSFSLESTKEKMDPVIDELLGAKQ